MVSTAAASTPRSGLNFFKPIQMKHEEIFIERAMRRGWIGIELPLSFIQRFRNQSGRDRLPGSDVVEQRSRSDVGGAGEIGRRGSITVFLSIPALLLEEFDCAVSGAVCYDGVAMAIPNIKRFRPFCPTCNENYTLMAVLPKDANVDAFLAEAVTRHDHKAFADAKAAQTKVRVGQQKQKKAK